MRGLILSYAKVEWIMESSFVFKIQHSNHLHSTSRKRRRSGIKNVLLFSEDLGFNLCLEQTYLTSSS